MRGLVVALLGAFVEGRRLLLAEVGTRHLERQLLGGAPVEGGVDGVFRDHRQRLAGLAVVVVEHPGQVGVPVQGRGQLDEQVAFDTFHPRLAGVVPLGHTAAGADGVQHVGITDDLVLVVVAKVRGTAAPGTPVVHQADFLVDADLGLEVGVALQVAATVIGLLHAATVAAAVQQVVGVGLVQVRGLVGARDTAFDRQCFGQLVRKVQAGAEVVAEGFVVVETQARGNGGVADNDVVLDEQRIAAGGHLRAAAVEADQSVVNGRVRALRAQRALVIERFVQVLAAQGQHMLGAAHGEWQVHFAAQARIAQARHGGAFGIGGTFGAACQALVEAPVAHVLVGQHGLAGTPGEIAQVGQVVGTALHHIGFVAVQAGHELDVTTAVAVHGVAGKDIALAAVAGTGLEAVLVVQLPAQQAIDVLVAYAFAARHQRTGGMPGVDVQVVGIGLGQAAVQAEAEVVGQAAAQVEVGPAAGALGAVFRQLGVQADAALELVGGALGDDIDHPAHGAGAVTCGRRATEDLDALDRFCWYPVGFTAGIAVAVPAIAHGIACAGWLAVDEDQGVFRAHAAQVDLPVVATRAAGAVAGQVHPGLAADDVGQVIRWRMALDIFGGDDRRTQGLACLAFGGDQGVLDYQRVVGDRHLQHLTRTLFFGLGRGGHHGR